MWLALVEIFVVRREGHRFHHFVDYHFRLLLAETGHFLHRWPRFAPAVVSCSAAEPSHRQRARFAAALRLVE